MNCKVNASQQSDVPQNTTMMFWTVKMAYNAPVTPFRTRYAKFLKKKIVLVKTLIEHFLVAKILVKE